MKNKVIFLSSLLLLWSLLLGYFLGVLDFFGFLSGEHTLNLVSLGLALFTWHLLGLTLFLIDLDDSHHELTYLVTSVGFGIVFFAFNQGYLATLLATCSFFLFQIVTEKMLTERAAKFVHFSTREVVFPIIRRSFLFLLSIIVIIGFFQSQSQANREKLVTGRMIRSVLKPVIPLVNRFFTAQLQNQLGTPFGWKVPIEEVQLGDLINSQATSMANDINRRLALYLPLIPFFFAAIIFLLVSPLIGISQIIFLPIVRFLIMGLIRTRVLVISEEEVKREILKL